MNNKLSDKLYVNFFKVLCYFFKESLYNSTIVLYYFSTIKNVSLRQDNGLYPILLNLYSRISYVKHLTRTLWETSQR